jgi:hypothetical protein
MKIERILARSVVMALVCTMACAPEIKRVPATQLTVRVSADAPLQSSLGSLRVRTAAPSQGRWTQRLQQAYEAAELHWPVDLVLVPKQESDVDDTFEIIVEALDVRGTVLAQSRVLTSYVLREARLLPLGLASCADTTGGVCEENPGCFGPSCRTCLVSGCGTTPVVQAADLPPAIPTDEPDAGNDLDAESQPITGTDAGARVDTGAGAQPSASPDAGGGDASPRPGSPCDNACDPLASCSVVSGNAACSCPTGYSTSNGGKTCVRASMDGGGVPDAATPGSDASGPGSDAAMPPSGKLPRVTTTDGAGPFTAVRVTSAGPGGWLVYPAELGQGGAKHPLFVFATGAGTAPAQYQDHLDRYASYGFVTYAAPRATGDGTELKAGLDWLIEQNGVSSSPLFQKLDPTKVCAGGHSQGGLSAFAFGTDPRLTTTIHISAGSFDGMGPSKLRRPTMFVAGDSDSAAANCQVDFQNSTLPTFYTKIQAADHIGSAREALPVTVAWLLWQLAGQEDQWKKEFLEPGGKFQTGRYMSQTKNW